MKKTSCGNQMSFVTKDLSKDIMTRSRLRNKYLKYKTEEISSYILSKKINMFLFSEKLK